MPPPTPSPPPPLPPQTEIQIHTYHCLCTTHLLTTPYTLSTLPHRSPPALDNAIILPLPALTSSSLPNNTTSNPDANPTPTTINEPDDVNNIREEKQESFLPSLLSPSMRLARKVIVVRREDGFVVLRVWIGLIGIFFYIRYAVSTPSHRIFGVLPYSRTRTRTRTKPCIIPR